MDGSKLDPKGETALTIAMNLMKAEIKTGKKLLKELHPLLAEILPCKEAMEHEQTVNSLHNLVVRQMQSCFEARLRFSLLAEAGNDDLPGLTESDFKTRIAYAHYLQDCLTMHVVSAVHVMQTYGWVPPGCPREYIVRAMVRKDPDLPPADQRPRAKWDEAGGFKGRGTETIQ